METFNIQIDYKVPGRSYGKWATPVMSVNAKTRKEACIAAMNKAERLVPSSITLDCKELKNVLGFWTYKLGSKINDPINGDIKAKDL